MFNFQHQPIDFTSVWKHFLKNWFQVLSFNQCFITSLIRKNLGPSEGIAAELQSTPVPELSKQLSAMSVAVVC